MADLTVEAITAPSFSEGLGAITLPDIRSRRDAANQVESGLSYLRRLAQGRLDIVLAECQRRADGRPAADLADLVDRLPEILGDHVHAPGPGRLSSIDLPDEVDADLQARIEALLPTPALSHLSDLDDADIAAAAAGLEEVERHVSAQRRALHEVVDRLQEEIVRRYRSGAATVEHLLE